MAGIYLHIPFCKQACHYCDFHFSTTRKNQRKMVDAMLAELRLRNPEWSYGPVETIYFGGGSPSLLTPGELADLMEAIQKDYGIRGDAEVTLEVNPDDVNTTSLRDWRSAGVNRLSIGVQSFDDHILKWMNRAHDGEQALASIHQAKDAGFENLTMDLIYGLPDMDNVAWGRAIQKFISLDIPHLSAYTLTIESGTVFGHRVKKGKMEVAVDTRVAAQMIMLYELMGSEGYEAYEVSNFAKDGMYAKHNTSYWQGVDYMGIGPSAHSLFGEVRSWNISNNNLYIKELLQEHRRPYTAENLTLYDRYNEYVMTRLRTQWGCNLIEIQSKFGESFLNIFQSELRQIDPHHFREQGGNIVLTPEGRCVSDHIASSLFASE
ncbi:MAG: radical SAM family heme chaperone HemW [Flavobacteriales bacterium]|nr:radical SAM family heme chaperone HemW [Flavobacteriales bacterium]